MYEGNTVLSQAQEINVDSTIFKGGEYHVIDQQTYNDMLELLKLFKKEINFLHRQNAYLLKESERCHAQEKEWQKTMMLALETTKGGLQCHR